MIALTPNSLEKLQVLLKSFGYQVRYEKGNFRTGACILQNSKVVVVNKFSNIEVKVQSLIQLVQSLNEDESPLSEKEREFYRSVKQTTLSI